MVRFMPFTNWIATTWSNSGCLGKALFALLVFILSPFYLFWLPADLVIGLLRWLMWCNRKGARILEERESEPEWKPKPDFYVRDGKSGTESGRPYEVPVDIRPSIGKPLTTIAPPVLTDLGIPEETIELEGPSMDTLRTVVDLSNRFCSQNGVGMPKFRMEYPTDPRDATGRRTGKGHYLLKAYGTATAGSVRADAVATGYFRPDGQLFFVAFSADTTDASGSGTFWWLTWASYNGGDFNLDTAIRADRDGKTVRMLDMLTGSVSDESLDTRDLLGARGNDPAPRMETPFEDLDTLPFRPEPYVVKEHGRRYKGEFRATETIYYADAETLGRVRSDVEHLLSMAPQGGSAHRILSVLEPVDSPPARTRDLPANAVTMKVSLLTNKGRRRKYPARVELMADTIVRDVGTTDTVYGGTVRANIGYLWDGTMGTADIRYSPWPMDWRNLKFRLDADGELRLVE